MAHAKILFFIGKGGVGKTTCSVSTAVNLAENGRKVLVVSLDPAHNAGDVLNIPLSHRKTTVTSRLDAIEINLEHLIQQYLKRSSDTMRQIYKYLTVINLDKLLEIIRYSPGIEEYATLEALNEILAENVALYDVIVFDTAPTGLTLRVLALPSISLLWTEKLTDIRRKILSLRSSIEHIHGERVLKVGEIEEKLASSEHDDHTMQELLRYRTEIEQTRRILTNPDDTSVVAVLNAEEMPLVETQRAADTLHQFQIPLKLLVINKVWQFQEIPPAMEVKIQRQAEMIAKIRHLFAKYAVITTFWQPEEPHGVAQLQPFGAPITAFLEEQVWSQKNKS